MIHSFIARSLFSIVLLMGLVFCTEQSHTKRPLALGKPYAQCSFPSSKAMARLYVDEGSPGSMLSNFGYTVTYQDETTEEVIIFDATSSPGVDNIRCSIDGLLLERYPHNESYILDLDWIKKDLVKAPLTFYKSRLWSLEYASRVKDWVGIWIPTPTPGNP